MSLLGSPRRTAACAAGLLLLPLAGLALSPSCALTLDYHQCDVDSDCAPFAGDAGQAWCTAEHFCVSAIPPERLCPESFGSDDPAAFVMATLMETDIDVPLEKAVKLAVEEINKLQHGAGKPPIKLHLCRSSDTEMAKAAARHAVEQLSARAIVGPSTSDTVVAVTSYLVTKNVLAITPSATAMSITSLQDQNLVWRTAPSDQLQSDLLVTLVASEAPAPTAVVVVHEDTVYGSGLSHAFYAGYHTAEDTTFKGSWAYDSDDPAALTAAVGKALADAPSNILLIADTSAPRLLNAFGGDPAGAAARIFMTDSAQNTRLFTVDGTPGGAPTPASILSRVRGTTMATPSGNTYDFFRMAYQNKFGEDPGSTAFTANAYDATYLLALALAGSASASPTGTDLANVLSTKLARHGSATTFPVGPDSYLDAVNALGTGVIRLRGTTGLLEFDSATGDRLSPSDGARLVAVWGVDTSGAAPRFVTLPAP